MKKYINPKKHMFMKLPYSDVLEENQLAGLTRAVKLVGELVEIQTTPNWTLNAPSIQVKPVDVGFHFDAERNKWFFYDSGNQPNGIFCFWRWNEESQKYELAESFGVDMDGRPIANTKYASDDRDCTFDWMHNKTPLGEGDEEDYDVSDRMGRAVTSWDMESGVSLIRWTPPKWEKWMGHDFVKLMKQNFVSSLKDGHNLHSETAIQASKIMGF